MKRFGYRTFAMTGAFMLTLGFALWLEGEVTYPQRQVQQYYGDVARCRGTPPGYLCIII